MVTCVPSIAPMILGNPLVFSNPAHTSLTRSFVGHFMTFGAKSITAFITRRVMCNAVLLPTLNRSEIDLRTLKNKNKNYSLGNDINQYKHHLFLLLQIGTYAEQF